jgi:hypothetical protein
MTDAVPTQDEYQAAKARYADWTQDQHQHPTPAMLRDVATINAYEGAQPA